MNVKNGENVISIVNHKGGTGKTTTAINLAVALRDIGINTLLIDLDPQANLSFSLGIHDVTLGISDCLLGEASPKDCIDQREGIDVLPASRALSETEAYMAKTDNKPTYLKEALAQTQGYDVVLIDCPPSISLLTINALFASSYVLIPVQLDVLSVRGVELMMETIAFVQDTMNQELDVLGMLPVMVDFRKNLSREILEYIKSNYKERVFENYIRASVKLAEAPSYGKSVLSYAPNCGASSDYSLFAQELLATIADYKTAAV